MKEIDYNNLRVTDWLPTSVKEMKALGWDGVDVVLFSGDAYVDHPAFGAAVIGRTLQAAGYRVAIVPQPNWQDDLRDFRKFGAPRLFFGVSPGAMDSMVNHYTAARRRRSDDAYTPGGRHGARPDYPSVVYSRILRDLYPDTPIVVGGIEASLPVALRLLAGSSAAINSCRHCRRHASLRHGREDDSRTGGTSSCRRSHG